MDTNDVAAIVTGGASGLGGATVRRLPEPGGGGGARGGGGGRVGGGGGERAGELLGELLDAGRPGRRGVQHRRGYGQ